VVNLLVLGIDPGSVKTGWALIEAKGQKIKYIDSGILKFDSKLDFLMRIKDIKNKVKDLLENITPDQVAFESLIYVKSPTALMKLAQTRGIIISECIDIVEDKIFEYSPNLVKSTTTGHGHANKESIQKFLKMTLGISKFESHDESDALAIAMCHILSGGNRIQKSKGRSLKSSLAHRVKEL
jgi:crossover junction endodeoxyribonuclease RuvC